MTTGSLAQTVGLAVAWDRWLVSCCCDGNDTGHASPAPSGGPAHNRKKTCRDFPPMGHDVPTWPLGCGRQTSNFGWTWMYRRCGRVRRGAVLSRHGQQRSHSITSQTHSLSRTRRRRIGPSLTFNYMAAISVGGSLQYDPNFSHSASVPSSAILSSPEKLDTDDSNPPLLQENIRLLRRFWIIWDFVAVFLSFSFSKLRWLAL